MYSEILESFRQYKNEYGFDDLLNVFCLTNTVKFNSYKAETPEDSEVTPHFLQLNNEIIGNSFKAEKPGPCYFVCIGNIEKGLTKLARQYLAMSPTSVPSEPLFFCVF